MGELMEAHAFILMDCKLRPQEDHARSIKCGVPSSDLNYCEPLILRKSFLGPIRKCYCVHSGLSMKGKTQSNIKYGSDVVPRPLVTPHRRSSKQTPLKERQELLGVMKETEGKCWDCSGGLRRLKIADRANSGLIKVWSACIIIITCIIAAADCPNKHGSPA